MDAGKQTPPSPPPGTPATETTNDGSERNRLPAEPEKNAGRKRRRLTKAFSRPLDKKVRKSGVVRDVFTFPEADYRCLVELKERLLAQGIKVKKSRLLQAGFALLFALGEDELKALVSKVACSEDETD
ncbi:MAG: hypothetical protein LBD67_10915 [Candidatus Accumulibacter sp.]|jgi:hypothetical protein|nr:hypothetical protein [Accumulibacter sp.]